MEGAHDASRGSILSTKELQTSIRSRELAASDIAAVAEMFGRGLGYSTRRFLRIFDRITQHRTPPGFPKYGYVLEANGSVVGAILLIFSEIRTSDRSSIRCHVTSWYVDPPYRSYGALFYLKALSLKDVTYINLSARSSALPFLKIQGFQKYSRGQFVSFPVFNWLSRPGQAQGLIVDGPITPNAPFEPFERDLLIDHALYGCLAIWCVTTERAHPFVFQKRLFKGFIPGVQVIYCRDPVDLVTFARPIGAYLAARGQLIVRIDANGPMQGLTGMYFDCMEPRFYKGARPRLGDLAYTQTAMDYVRIGH
jgi:hypothetical protein